MKKYEENRCRHRIKRNYPYGHKSSPIMVCKDCNQLVSRYEIQKSKQSNRPRERIISRKKK